MQKYFMSTGDRGVCVSLEVKKGKDKARPESKIACGTDTSDRMPKPSKRGHGMIRFERKHRCTFVTSGASPAEADL